MDKHFALWKGVAHELTTRFATCGKYMLESGAHDGSAVTIDFLAQTVTPHHLAYRRESHIAVCAYFLKRMEAEYANTLVRARIKVRRPGNGPTLFDVRLDTHDPAVCVNGTLVHAKGTTYAWQRAPMPARGGNAAGAPQQSGSPDETQRNPGTFIQPERETGDSAFDSDTTDEDEGGYAWIHFPAAGQDKEA